MSLYRKLFTLAASLLPACISFGQTTVPAAIPKPAFQGDYFGEMARSFCTIRAVDLKSPALLVQRDKDGQIVRVPIRDDTELRFRDAWGELGDFFPGQHVMLFMYVDEERKWTYPRAVQDDIQVSALHGWYAAVTAIDPQSHTFSTHREEKDKQGKITKALDKQYTFDPAVKVWKGNGVEGISALKIGDEVIQQLVEKDGKLVAVEILDRAGDAAVKALQIEQYRKDQDRLGLTAYVTDVEVLTGAALITVPWSGSDRARALRPGDVMAMAPVDGGPPFAAAMISIEQVDSRKRLHMAINPRCASRLSVGQSLRLFMPGTGPQPPMGKTGVPTSDYK